MQYMIRSHLGVKEGGMQWRSFWAKGGADPKSQKGGKARWVEYVARVDENKRQGWRYGWKRDHERPWGSTFLLFDSHGGLLFTPKSHLLLLIQIYPNSMIICTNTKTHTPHKTHRSEGRVINQNCSTCLDIFSLIDGSWHLHSCSLCACSDCLLSLMD